ncbi:MAG: hypothetical protein FWE02_01755 [Defluviitaleaceae bacterium]|nr:hypothetical protein [Defluviitaleaceae bacterium]
MSSPLGAIASDIAMQLENGVITVEEANDLMREALLASQTGHMTLNTMDVDIGTIEEKMVALARLMDATHGIALASSMAEAGELEGAVGAEETSENTEEKAKEGETATDPIEDILKDAIPGRDTKGKTRQYDKKGNFEDTSKDFDSLNPTDVKNINSLNSKVRTGKLPDGTRG